jgi:hypothetical protein
VIPLQPRLVTEWWVMIVATIAAALASLFWPFQPSLY